MSGTTEDEASAALRSACLKVGLDPTDAELLRRSENVIYRLRGDVVVRISRPGQQAAALREVVASQWLEASGVDAVQVVLGIEQPVDVDGRAVTFWRELPPHHHGTPAQVAGALKKLHSLTPPTAFDPGMVAPFVRLEERIDRANFLPDDDRHWMREHLAELRQRWDELPTGLPWCVIHGDAWGGNVVAADDGRVILLDLERTSLGPPEWDLVHTAIKWSSFGWISAKQYGEFCDVYGYDVTTWEGFELLRDIREFRMTTMAIQRATENSNQTEQALVRLACISGSRGLRPWHGWTALS
ncbi:aminoglycoside phosphotransferase family protein [Nocardia blacklockiae]|uniref:aminoglycoside phosphotransferase family protein n=1 Tax=Nocardia blacklockiae TaxID=480036 RepID=UPI0018944748|nr:aminoglycoside phosphotransferase family protein [Nocardia blacklockiae]MBF6171300.1 aminoglycoside phosphotransferase family protein [Nocardia blacklockiae]